MSMIQPDDRGLIVSCAHCGQNNRLVYERLNQLPRCAKCGTQLSAPGAGRWLVTKVNTEELPALGQRHRVTAIPLLVLFQHGSEIARQAGALSAAAIRQFIARPA